MASAAQQANLARTRENQRRSRARRKEYLHELENRLRQCEIQGIEASAEIQRAARKVAEENTKLRLLLNKNGIGDDMIEKWLQSEAISEGPGTEASSPRPTHSDQPSHSLERLLAPRRPVAVGAPFLALPGQPSGTSSALELPPQRQGREKADPSAGSYATTPLQEAHTHLPPASSPQGLTASTSTTIHYPRHEELPQSQPRVSIPHPHQHTDWPGLRADIDGHPTHGIPYDMQMQMASAYHHFPAVPAPYGTPGESPVHGQESHSFIPPTTASYLSTSTLTPLNADPTQIPVGATGLLSSLGDSDAPRFQLQPGCGGGMGYQMDGATFDKSLGQ